MSEEEAKGSGSGVRNIHDLEAEGIEIEVAKQTRGTGWGVKQLSGSVEDPSILKLHLTKPPVRKINLLLPYGHEIDASNMKGVTIQDALVAIHRVYRKKKEDEIEDPYLAGFEWDGEESWTRLVVKLQRTPASG